MNRLDKELQEWIASGYAKPYEHISGRISAPGTLALSPEDAARWRHWTRRESAVPLLLAEGDGDNLIDGDQSPGA